MTTSLLALLALALTAAPEQDSPAPPAPQAAAQPDITLDQLLDRLEKADADLRTLTAKVVYARSYKLQGDTHTRLGDIAFRSEPGPDPAQPPRRSFNLTFDKLYVDAIEQSSSQTFIFDGEWLIEKKLPEKTFQRRRIALPGDNFDPFRVGNDNAMIPLPIGQRKADILAHYTAEIVPPTQSLEDEPNFAESVKDAVQLHLKPIPRDEKPHFLDIRLWYDRKTLIPLMSRAEARDNVSIVQLVGTKLNAPEFPHDRISTADPRPEEGFTIYPPIDEVPVPPPAQEPATP